MTKQGQKVYKRALSEIRGTKWWSILFPVRDRDSERMLKSFRAECDMLGHFNTDDGKEPA